MRGTQQLRADLRKEMVRYARALHERGWVANHDGNASARLGNGHFLITPTATSKADVSEKNLLEVDDQGKRVSGTSRPFSELNLHLAVYRARADVAAVVHAHPPSATALACSGQNLIERPFIAEAVVSLGPVIPLLPYAPPGPAAAAALEPVVQDVDAVLLGNHGVLTWGPSLELAHLRMELVEHLATIALRAGGQVRPLPEGCIDALLAARARARLGHAADRAVELHGRASVTACAPAPHANVEVRAPGRAGSQSGDGPRSSTLAGASPDVHRIIREEIVKILARE